ncbi:MAG: hypothetical protein AB1918_00805 [Pseudomonadota bacterium]
MIRMLTAVAAAALLAVPAMAQDVSAGGKASRDQDRVTPLSEPTDQQSLGDGQSQDPSQVQDQTAQIPGEEGEAASIPGTQDEPVTGSNLGQTDQLDRDQTSEQAQQALPPIEDDQAAQVGELEEGQALPGTADQQTAQTPEEQDGILGDQEQRSEQWGGAEEEGSLDRQGIGRDSQPQPGVDMEEEGRR